VSQPSTEPEMPKLSESLLIRILWSMVSKAALRSKDNMLSALCAIVRPSVRPTVRLSHGWISQNRIMQFLPYTVASSLLFLRDKFYLEILTDFPLSGGAKQR